MTKFAFRSSRIWIGLVVVLLLSVTVWIGCGQKFENPNAPEITQQFKKLNPNDPQIRAVMELQERNTPALLKNSDVVGTATGLTENGKPAIVVFAQSERLTKGKAIPTEIESVPVVVKVTGPIKALAGSAPTDRFDRPVPIGVTTGNFNQCSSGTIACRVKDSSGNVYALSNNHVYALVNIAPKHSWIVQPGRVDETPVCNRNRDNILGTLGDFEEIKFDGSLNVIDAATALTTTDDLGKSTPEGGYGTPKSQTKPALVGQSVKKFGRTTGLTKGEVTFINAIVGVNYGDPFGVAFFKDQIIVESDTRFIGAGDSGSLLVNSGRYPVGLLYAGTGDGLLAVANPIDAVLDQFGVTIDGE
ncbi:MAG: hypothetical protein ACE5HO_08980 [bacterium]